MTAQPADLYDVLKKLRYDLTSCQAKLTDALNILGQLHLPEKPNAPCPNCGLDLKGPRTLAEHLYTSHNGPLPDHWAQADTLADTDPHAYDQPPELRRALPTGQHQ